SGCSSSGFGKGAIVPDRNRGILKVRPPIQRWAKHVQMNYLGCWIWKSALDTGGYGQFYDVKTINSHRWTYQHFIGPIPPGLDLDHLCRNRACCNPMHLEPVTRSENILRGTGP